MAFFSQLKEKYEAFARKVTEVVQAYNDISRKYNELQNVVDLMKNENAHLTKSLNEAKATISVREAELKRAEQQTEYYEDKSSSTEMFTTIKVRAKMMKEFTEGKTSLWGS